MPSSLLLKLKCGARLDDADCDRLQSVVSKVRRVKSHENIIREGDVPEDVHLILDGLACRYKNLRDGKRQIMALLIPGDFCDLHVAILGEMDHGIATLTACKVVDIPRATVDELILDHPRIARSLWWATLVDEAILREWLVNMGNRPADRRMAHLFFELFVRMRTVGRVSQNSYRLPLTQEELGDVLGLSIAHVNRTLQHLREDGLVIFADKILTIPDVEQLRSYADFNPNYLHLDVGRRESALPIL